MPWLWIIRGTCLGLLALGLGIWGLSYVCHARVVYNGSYFVVLEVAPGAISVGCNGLPLLVQDTPVARPPGWSVSCWPIGSGEGPRFSVAHQFWLERGLKWTDLYVAFPLWFPTLILAVASWIAWRKTGRNKTGRGFPVEPRASRQEIPGE